MLNLKKLLKNYEDSARSYAELVPFMSLISPGMVINKDGSLLVCYSMRGVDQEGLPQHEIDRYANLVEHAFRGMSERITVWFTVDRRRITEYPKSAFRNSIAEWVDQCWKHQFDQQGQYQNFLYVSILYTPPKGADGFMERMAYFVKNEGASVPKAFFEAVKSMLSLRKTVNLERAQLDALTGDFEEKLASFEQTILDVDLRRMHEDQLLGFLHRRCSPTSYQANVKVPEIPMYLDSYLPGDQLVARGDTLRFSGPSGTKNVAAISLKDWPDATHPGILDDLLAVPGEITISQVFRFANGSKAKSFIESVEKHNMALQKNLIAYLKESLTKEESNQVNHGRVLLAQDASDALTEMTSLNRSYGYYNCTVVSYGDSEEDADATLRLVNQVLQRRGYMLVRETMHLLSAYAGTMPGQWGELVRWHFVSSANLADLAPVRTLGIGQQTNEYFKEQRGDGIEQPALTVLATEFNTPYYFNFHQGDLAHGLVIGPSRTGKSSFMNFLLSQFQKYEPCVTIIFDKDYSCKIPTLLQGGDHIDMSMNAEGSVKLNPLHLLSSSAHRIWLTNWIIMLLNSRSFECKSADIENIQDALEQLSTQPKEKWRLMSLASYLSPRLKEEISQWCGNGTYARFFDNDSDTFNLGSKVCIEMGGLLKEPVVAALFIEYAFYSIQIRLDGKPTVIYIEEAWFMLAYERFAAGIDNWLRTLAKKNAFLIMATQSLSEVANSKIFASIIDNIPNRIFLPNPNALTHAEMYRNMFSLNDEQINRIRNGIPKRNYYIVTPMLSRMVDVSFSREILAVVRSDQRAQNVFNKHYQTAAANDGWYDGYFKEILNA